MLRLRSLTVAAVLALAALAAGAGPASAVLVTAGTGSGLAGQTVDVDINTASVTGLGVVSWQLRVAYSNTVVTAIDVLTTGTLTGAAGWGTPAFSVTNVSSTGTISISAAGTTALTGAGSLVRVRFTINPALLNGSSTSLALSNVLFNEGTPPATTANGSISVGVTPQINVAPDAGEIIRGQTLQFTVSGGVVNPVSWVTTDNAIATISSTGLLTGVAPGAIRVTATDAALHSNQTTDDILVRGMGVTAGSGSTPQNLSVIVPVTVTSLAGLGIRSGQVKLSWAGSFVSATAVTTPPGTLLNGWGSVVFGANANDCTVDFAGTSDLAGSGVLFYVTFTGRPDATGSSALTVATALFNETLPAKVTNGTISVTTLPPIYVNPDQVTLLAGATQQMTISGTPTLPITWSVLDPTVASISPTGLLTAVHGGLTQVRAQDAIGSVDLNTFVRVYDLRASLGTVTCAPGRTVRMALVSDRPVGPLGIRSEQARLTWVGTAIAAARAVPSALWSQWGGGVPLWSATATSVTAAAAGVNTLVSAGSELAAFEFDVSPSATPGTNVAITLDSYVCNEGDPSPQLVSGILQIRNTVDVADGSAEFSLSAPSPNPAHADTRIAFSLPASTPGGTAVSLEIYGLDGARVRTLVNGTLPAGAHDVVWDARDASGRPVGPGLYFLKLSAAGKVLSRKLGVVH